MGSAAITAASATTDHPVRQGYINMTGTFFDTIVICTVTGLAICCSGVLGAVDGAGAPVDGAALTILAFQTVLGPWGARFVSLSIVLFAFATIVGWEYQGEVTFTYLSRGRVRLLYRVVYALAAFLGAGLELGTVFAFADICNALMCGPNLLCLAAMSGEACRAIREKPGKKL